ncbi:MAG: hypothetical protein GY863_15335 [bacterium]|nr:hypothetical protein [bacterium]
MKINRTGLKGVLITLLLVIMIITPLSAQTGISVSYYLIRDDNAFKSRDEYREMINTASLMLSRSYSLKNVAFQAFYGLDMSAFSEYSDQKNHSHMLGMFSRIVKDDFITDIGFHAQLRRNEAQYIYYNTDNYSFFLKTEYQPDLNEIYTLGLNYKKISFNEFSDLNNTAYRAYGSFQRFFQSRLSISGELALNVKDYTNQSVYGFYGYSGGMNGMMGPPRYSEEPVNAMQVTADFNIGKSITDKTGVNMRFGSSKYLGDPIEAYSNGIYYYTENDLYDDPSSYEHNYVSFNLTRQFAVGFQGKAGYLIQDKNYSGTPALSDTGDMLNDYRNDYRNEFSLVVSKKFDPKWNVPVTLNTYFRFLIRQNDSNDPYYNFTDHLGIFGITISKK